MDESCTTKTWTTCTRHRWVHPAPQASKLLAPPVLWITQAWTAQACLLPNNARCKRMLLHRKPKRKIPWQPNQLPQCRRLLDQTRSQASPKCLWWTTGISMTTLDSLCVALINQELLRRYRQQLSPNHLPRPTDRPTFLRRRPRRWSTIAIKLITSNAPLNPTTPTNSSRCVATCVYSECLFHLLIFPFSHREDSIYV